MSDNSPIKGFKVAAVEAGLRYKKRPDLGLIVALESAVAAGVFTTSLTKAAPVLWSERNIASGRCRAVLVNAGQANAQTGDEGLNDCREAAEALAKELGIEAGEILLASTGVIGQRIKMDGLTAAIKPLADNLAPDNLEIFSQAIMTTDLAPKTSRSRVEINGKTVNLWGAAKGSGMIAPNMATMLGFILTDAVISPLALKAILTEVTEGTFNRITIDGDTSTNDTLLVLASGKADNTIIDCPYSPEAAMFRLGLYEVAGSLARQIVLDGEGANHLVKIKVSGARTQEEATKAARTVSESPLVKTALFGRDANWGRIMAALGRSGAFFNPYAVDIRLDGVFWVRNGMDNGHDKEAAEIMAKKEYVIAIDLHAGPAGDEFLTCDFSFDYVKINGSYRS